MSKINITIEDNENGTVNFVCDPSVETMIKMQKSGHKLTASHGIALFLVNKLRELKTENEVGNVLSRPTGIKRY